MWCRLAVIGALSASTLAGSLATARAQELTLEAVNEATISPAQPARKKLQSKSRAPAPSPVMLKAQILLDRARFSPGVIDGLEGENVQKALAAFEKERGLEPDGQLDEAVWAKLVETSGDPVLIDYTVSDADVKGPFEKKIPEKLEAMTALSRLAYTGPEELLAEKFHVTEELLKALNPKKRLDQAGTRIVVPNLMDQSQKDSGVARAAKRDSKGVVARIEIDKAGRALRALDKEGKLVAFYPASIGSDEKPAPSGEHTVRAVAENPAYTYNPDYKFKGVKADRKLTIKPGPNNPVGTVWIDLTAESYGIHGTPEPSKVGKSYSHGCVRLTNWDVKELAGMVEKGTTVAFLD